MNKNKLSTFGRDEPGFFHSMNQIYFIKNRLILFQPGLTPLNDSQGSELIDLFLLKIIKYYK